MQWDCCVNVEVSLGEMYRVFLRHFASTIGKANIKIAPMLTSPGSLYATRQSNDIYTAGVINQYF
jgi:hypothetical protein